MSITGTAFAAGVIVGGLLIGCLTLYLAAKVIQAFWDTF